MSAARMPGGAEARRRGAQAGGRGAVGDGRGAAHMPEAGQEVYLIPAGSGAPRAGETPAAGDRVKGVRGWVMDIEPPLVTVEGVGVPLPIAPGAAVVVSYHDERGVYRLAGRVESLRAHRTPPLPADPERSPADRFMAVIRAERVERLQRREYFRWPARWAVAYAVCPAGAAPDAAADAVAWVRAETREVSGGGLSMVAPGPLAPGDRLLLKLALPGGDLVCAEGRVVRVAPAGETPPGLAPDGVGRPGVAREAAVRPGVAPDGAARAGPAPAGAARARPEAGGPGEPDDGREAGAHHGPCLVAVEFTDILGEARERIVRQILAAQLRLRRQGLL